MKNQDMKLVEDTKFASVRDDVCLQACIYNHEVAPICQNVLQESANFFVEFNTYFKDFDTLKEGIDLLIEDSQKITTGFMISKKIHDPVLKEA